MLGIIYYIIGKIKSIHFTKSLIHSKLLNFTELISNQNLIILKFNHDLSFRFDLNETL